MINGETMYVASQSGSLDSFDVANGRLNWSIPHADFFSRIYHDGEDLYTAHPLRRIDGLTGEVLEEIDVPDHDSDEWPVETMAASDGLFLVMRHRSTSRFSLVRLSPTREMLWQVALDDTGWAGNAPIIIDGLAIVGLEESVVAFDVASGEQRWRVSSSFAHVAAAEGNVILIDVAARMTVHDARTGDERFRLNVTAVQHPVVADGQVFAAVADRSVRAFDLASLEEVWRTDDVLSLPVEGLVADESAIYAVSHNSIDGVLEAASLDRGSGEIVWSSTLGEERPGAMLGNQMVLPGEGALAVLEADGQISVWG